MITTLIARQGDFPGSLANCHDILLFSWNTMSKLWSTENFLSCFSPVKTGSTILARLFLSDICSTHGANNWLHLFLHYILRRTCYLLLHRLVFVSVYLLSHLFLVNQNCKRTHEIKQFSHSEARIPRLPIIIYRYKFPVLFIFLSIFWELDVSYCPEFGRELCLVR